MMIDRSQLENYKVSFFAMKKEQTEFNIILKNFNKAKSILSENYLKNDKIKNEDKIIVMEEEFIKIKEKIDLAVEEIRNKILFLKNEIEKLDNDSSNI